MSYYTRTAIPGFACKQLHEHVKTLYVCRPVLNAGDIIEWAKSAGFATTYPPEDMHVTIAYSKQPVDWGVIGYQPLNLEVPGEFNGRDLKVLGEDTAVLQFWSWALTERWASILTHGASWDYETYQPHISISRDIPANLDDMYPYTGPITLGPEKITEVKTNWSDDITEKGDKPGHEFHGNQHTAHMGKGGAEEPGQRHHTLARRHGKEWTKAHARGDKEAMKYHDERERYHFLRGAADRPLQGGWSHGFSGINKKK